MGEAAPTIWIVAGETSGDGYGARLANELRGLCPDVCLKGMGGAAMRNAGVEILVDSSELDVMGIVEVLGILGRIIRVFRDLTSRAAAERPDAVVLIDYPGFNLRLAKKLHALGIRVVYYVSPQVWAWKKGRIPKIVRTVDRMMTIFPFEPPVYDGTGLDVEFVGHPLLEVLAEERDESIERDPNTILLLPGSRSGEIKRILPTIAETACLLSRERPGLRFVLPTPRESTANRVRHLLASLPHAPEVQVEIGNARRWMQEAGTGIAASGTVTVEAAILGLPLVSVYRMNPITCALAALIVQLPYFTMVNLIAGKEVFPELLQGEFTPENTLAALRPLLPDGEKRAEVEQGMRDVIEALGGQRGASRRAATSVLEVATRG